MASSIPSEAIILIGVIIAAVALSQSFITSMAVIQQKTISSTASMGDKLNTDVKVIYAAKINSINNTAIVKIWVKNIGTSTIYEGSIRDSDVFFGKEGSFQRYDFGLGWTFILLQGTDNAWRPGETMEISLTPDVLNTGEYYARYVTYNGVKSEIFFSIGG